MDATVKQVPKLTWDMVLVQYQFDQPAGISPTGICFVQPQHAPLFSLASLIRSVKQVTDVPIAFPHQTTSQVPQEPIRHLARMLKIKFSLNTDKMDLNGSIFFDYLFFGILTLPHTLPPLVRYLAPPPDHLQNPPEHVE